MKLQIGHNADFEIRLYSLAAKVSKPVKILFASDFHCRKKSNSLLDRIRDHINRLDLDLVLLGGDYIESKAGLKVFENFLTEIDPSIPKLAVFGNHDRRYKKSLHKVFENTGVQIAKAEVLEIKGNQIGINTKDIENLDFNIELRHDPKHLQLKSADLGFAGHLHGGQFILYKQENLMYPLKWFYKSGYLDQLIQNKLNLISKGLGDTLPIRFNCPKDIILVNLSPEVP
ncbi:hypothetical protein GYB22_01205 [bacterium]|nr:hypothetical protein [bacterium]